MKTLLIATAAVVAATAALPAPAQAWHHVRQWNITTTTVTPPPSIETVPVDPGRHIETPAERAAWCKANYCPPELPLR